jgi:hypothetical protein
VRTGDGRERLRVVFKVWPYGTVLLDRSLKVSDKSTVFSDEFIGDVIREVFSAERKVQKYQVSGIGEGR